MQKLKREILVGEFLDLLRERAEEKFNGKIHQAFVDWYIDAEFGRVDWRFTDDGHLHSRATIQSIDSAFVRFHSNGRSGQQAKKLVRALTKKVWATWRASRKVDPERWTPNNFFKSKFGNQTILKKAYPAIQSGLRLLGRELFHSN